MTPLVGSGVCIQSGVCEGRGLGGTGRGVASRA